MTHTPRMNPLKAFFGYIERFLSVRRVVRSDTLVLECWLWDSMVREAAAHVSTQNYKRIIIAGVRSDSASESRAQRTAQRLIALGIPESSITITERTANRHRTAAAGHALKDWLSEHPAVSAMSIFTYSPHARKTFMIFKKILGKKYSVGIIPALPGGDASAKRRRTFNFRLMHAFYLTRQLIGCIYAAVWPFPPTPPAVLS